MKSRLFQLGASEGFSEDIKLLAEMRESDFKNLIKRLDGITHLHHLPDLDEILPLSMETNISADDYRRVIQAVAFLFKQESDYSDSIDYILEDLLDQEAITAKEVDSLKNKIESARSFYEEKVNLISRSQADLTASFPTLQHIHTRCVQVARYKPNYNVTTDSPDEYLPELVGLTPLLMVQIDINRFGENTRFSFAMSEPEIVEFIKRFQLAKVQFDKIAMDSTN
ncbi:hypothetical protein ACFL45_02505 [Candidatus Neomarinimicrobiota bacterium]